MNRDEARGVLLPDFGTTYGPTVTTPEQQAAINASAAIVKARRAAAKYEPLWTPEEITRVYLDQPVRNCARCAHLGGFNAEHQRGWCCHLRHMVNTRTPCRCESFEAP